MSLIVMPCKHSASDDPTTRPIDVSHKKNLVNFSAYSLNLYYIQKRSILH